MAKKVVKDATQRDEGDAKDWVNEPLSERHPDMIAHTERPFNAEPPNYALRDMITAKGLHYRRQHTPVPVVDEQAYRVSISMEDSEPRQFSLADLKSGYQEHDIVVTFMCTGNRRSEFNTDKDGETMGLPWRNGSIGTARWSGCFLNEVLKVAGIEERVMDSGYNFLTFYGLENYHVSVPLSKVFQRNGDCLLAWSMNGEPLPRDHGFPLRVIIPGFVGARSVKWIDRIIVTKNEVDGMHQVGIAYKQLAPNIKALSDVSGKYIEALPPIDHVPITSAITQPEPGACVRSGGAVQLKGYAYSGAGLAVIRVDISVDGGETWSQADFKRAHDTQNIRSNRAWAWVQWQHTVTIPENAPANLKILCKAVDDQYNQQPHDPSPIWNLRGILNNSWGQVQVKVTKDGIDISEAAMSGDGTVANVGIKVDADLLCPECRQRFTDEKAMNMHWRFIHDPSRHQED